MMCIHLYPTPLHPTPPHIFFKFLVGSTVTISIVFHRLFFHFSSYGHVSSQDSGTRHDYLCSTILIPPLHNMLTFLMSSGMWLDRCASFLPFFLYLTAQAINGLVSRPIPSYPMLVKKRLLILEME